MRPKPDTTHPNADAFPAGMSGPSLRALLHAGIRTMAQVAERTEKELLDLHGMGPKGIRFLKEGLARRGRRMRE